MNVKHPNRLYKSDRLNHIVSRMRLNQDITPAKLAQELQVSERTIYRDLRFLETGNALKKRYSRREGRYMLETELHLPPLTLTPSEALALYKAACNPALSQENFYASDLKSALGKLSTALSPAPMKEPNGPDTSLNNVSLALTADSMQRPTLEVIRRAMRTNRKLRLHYWSSEADKEQELVVAPYDLRQVEPSWYLLGHSEENSATRLFKINRVRTVELLPDRFRYPRRFSADTYFTRAWEDSGSADADIQVKIKFAPSAAPLISTNQGRPFLSLETEPDGSVLGTLNVNSVKELNWWVLSFGTAAEVLEPAELRRDLAQTAQAMVALYKT